MPWTVHYTPHGAYAKFSRNVSCEESMKLNEELFAHRFDNGPLRFIVYDHCAVTDFQISTTDIIRTADQHKDYVRGRSPYVVAIIAPASFIYGLGRMWQLLVEQAGIECTVVATRDEALAWLRSQGVVDDFDSALL